MANPLEILDPISTIVRLAIISELPVGVKLTVQNNSVVIDKPSLLQGIYRFFARSNRLNINNLCNPIKIYCQWTHAVGQTVVSQEADAFLRSRAIAGLRKLIETYSGTDLIEHSLRYYIRIFETNEELGENILYERFRQHWSINEIDVLCHMLRQGPDYINAADVVLRSKDVLTRKTVVELTQGLPSGHSKPTPVAITAMGDADDLA